MCLLQKTVTNSFKLEVEEIAPYRITGFLRTFSDMYSIVLCSYPPPTTLSCIHPHPLPVFLLNDWRTWICLLTVVAWNSALLWAFRKLAAHWSPQIPFKLPSAQPWPSSLEPCAIIAISLSFCLIVTLQSELPSQLSLALVTSKSLKSTPAPNKP